MAVLAVNPLVLQGIGLLGMFLSNCLGFSNLPAMLEARRRGILGDINPVVPPFLCGNCFAWCMYATAKQDPYMFCGNIFSALVGLFLCFSVAGLTPEPQKRLQLECLLLTVVGVLALLGFVAAVWAGTQLLGMIALLMVFFLFASPLSTLAMVIRTKNSASISRPFCIVQMCNCGVWLLYGLLTFDWFLGIPNAFGIATALMQAGVIIAFSGTVDANELLPDPAQMQEQISVGAAMAPSWTAEARQHIDVDASSAATRGSTTRFKATPIAEETQTTETSTPLTV